MINEMDKDGDGSISLEEFIRVLQHKIENQYSKVQIEEAFSYVEKDNQRITKEGLQKIFLELGENLSSAEIDQMFKEVAKEDRNYVTSEELSHFLQH